MVGRAVATTVWSRAASSMPVISPANTTRIWRWLSLAMGAAGSVKGFLRLGGGVPGRR